MPKNKPMDGAKGQPRKAKTHTHTAKEAVQRMFSRVGTVDTTMMENNMEEEASEAMQDVSENASDMETDEQKKRERALKQNMQETATVTSDTALPEQKKTRNDHQDISQSPVKALFQKPIDQAPFKTGPNKEVRSTTTKVLRQLMRYHHRNQQSRSMDQKGSLSWKKCRLCGQSIQLLRFQWMRHQQGKIL